MSELANVDGATGWFSVRCIFAHENEGIYEERLTLWRASGPSEAISLAEQEATEYAASLKGVGYVNLAQSYALFEPPEHGSEIFSLMRDSNLNKEEYIDRFFATGAERQGEV